MNSALGMPKSGLEELVNPSILKPRILLDGVTWQQYESLIATLSDRPRLRMTYLEVKIISPKHEILKTLIWGLMEIYALERKIPLLSCCCATYRTEATARGIEPDGSYCIGTSKEMPDLVIEVLMTSSDIDKLEVYKGLNVSEVWFWEGQFSVYQLQSPSAGYQPVRRSTFFPELDLALLATYVQPMAAPQRFVMLPASRLG